MTLWLDSETLHSLAVPEQWDVVEQQLFIRRKYANSQRSKEKLESLKRRPKALARRREKKAAWAKAKYEPRPATEIVCIACSKTFEHSARGKKPTQCTACKPRRVKSKGKT